MTRPLGIGPTPLLLAVLVAMQAAGGVVGVLTKKQNSSTPRPFEELPENSSKDLDAASDCATPASLPGNCVKIQNCQPLFSLVRQARSASGVHIDFLRRSQCGFDGRTPKVCCPQKGRAPSQVGQIPDWSRVAGFTPIPTEGMPKEVFPIPNEAPLPQPRSCGRQHVSTSLARVVGGAPARNDTVVKGRWAGMCAENPIPQHVGRLLNFAPQRICEPAKDFV